MKNLLTASLLFVLLSSTSFASVDSGVMNTDGDSSCVEESLLLGLHGVALSASCLLCAGSTGFLVPACLICYAEGGFTIFQFADAMAACGTLDDTSGGGDINIGTGGVEGSCATYFVTQTQIRRTCSVEDGFEYCVTRTYISYTSFVVC